MAQENYDQWPLPKLHMAPGGGALRAPFSNVMYKEITDVEKLVRSVGEELVRSGGGAGEECEEGLVRSVGEGLVRSVGEELVRSVRRSW